MSYTRSWNPLNFNIIEQLWILEWAYFFKKAEYRNWEAPWKTTDEVVYEWSRSQNYNFFQLFFSFLLFTFHFSFGCFIISMNWLCSVSISSLSFTSPILLSSFFFVSSFGNFIGWSFSFLISLIIWGRLRADQGLAQLKKCQISENVWIGVLEGANDSRRLDMKNDSSSSAHPRSPISRFWAKRHFFSCASLAYGLTCKLVMCFLRLW